MHCESEIRTTIFGPVSPSINWNTFVHTSFGVSRYDVTITFLTFAVIISTDLVVISWWNNSVASFKGTLWILNQSTRACCMRFVLSVHVARAFTGVPTSGMANTGILRYILITVDPWLGEGNHFGFSGIWSRVEVVLLIEIVSTTKTTCLVLIVRTDRYVDVFTGPLDAHVFASVVNVDVLFANVLNEEVGAHEELLVLSIDDDWGKAASILEGRTESNTSVNGC